MALTLFKFFNMKHVLQKLKGTIQMKKSKKKIIIDRQNLMSNIVESVVKSARMNES